MFDVNENVWIEASAGTGKTTTIIDRILQLIFTDQDIKKILILTFTNSACHEIQERIYKILHNCIDNQEFLYEICKKLNIEFNDNNQEQINAICKTVIKEVLQIKTIHGFCHEIIQNYIFNDNNSENIRIIEESESKLLINKALDQYISRRAKQEVSDDIDENHLLIKYNFDKCINLLNNLKNHDFIFENIKVKKITYNSEQISEIQSLNIQDIDADFKIYNQVLSWLKSSQNFQDYEKFREIFFTKTNQKRVRLPKIKNQILKNFIDTENKNILEWEEYFLIALNQQKINFFKELLEIYQQEKRKNNFLDYHDLINIVQHNISQDSEISYLLDWKIDHILVDEAQDNSTEQWKILYTIINEFFTGQSSRTNQRTFFIVGDPKQSIFSFQGASLNCFYKFQEILLKKSNSLSIKTSLIKKNHSYRNSQSIINLLNIIFQDQKILDHFQLKNIQFTTENPEIGQIKIYPLQTTKPNLQQEIHNFINNSYQINYQYDYLQNHCKIINLKNTLYNKINSSYVLELSQEYTVKFDIKIPIKNLKLEKYELISTIFLITILVNIEKELYNLPKKKSLFTEKYHAQTFYIDNIQDNQLRISFRHNNNTQHVVFNLRESHKNNANEALAEKITELIETLLLNHTKDEITILVQKRSTLLSVIQNTLNSKKIANNFNNEINLKNFIIITEIINFIQIISNPEIDFNWVAFGDSCFNIHNFDIIKNCPANNNMQSVWQNIQKHHIKLAKFIKYYVFHSQKLSIIGIIQLIWKNFYQQIIHKFGKKIDQIYGIFFDYIFEFSQQNPHNSTAKFLNFWDNNEEIRVKHIQNNSIKISTVHHAKGQENKIIILADANDITRVNLEKIFIYNNLPFLYQNNNFLFKAIYELEKDIQYQEYLRLMYVAITRSKSDLYIFGIQNNDSQYNSWYKIINHALIIRNSR